MLCIVWYDSPGVRYENTASSFWKFVELTYTENRRIRIEYSLETARNLEKYWCKQGRIHKEYTTEKG